jgi:hypothetical protein
LLLRGGLEQTLGIHSEFTSQETGILIGKLSQELGERTEFAWLPWWRHVCDIENGSSPMNSNQNPQINPNHHHNPNHQWHKIINGYTINIGKILGMAIESS